MTTLPERLHALRVARGWTMQQAAEASGLHTPQWHALETDPHANPTLTTLNRVAMGMERSLAELLYGLAVEHAPPTLAWRMRERRQHLGLSQTDAAKRAGFTRNEWSDMERSVRDNPTWTRLCQVARALDLSPGELLYGVTPETGDDDG